MYQNAGTGSCRVNDRTTKRNDSNYTKDILLPSSLNQYIFFFTHYYTKGPFSAHWLVASIKRGEDALQLNPCLTLSLAVFFEKSWEEADRCSWKLSKKYWKIRWISSLACHTFTHFFHRQLRSVVIYPQTIFSARACRVFVTQPHSLWAPGWFHQAGPVCVILTLMCFGPVKI